MLAARVGGCVSSQPRALACQSRPSRRARLAARHPACQAAQQLEGPRASAPLEDAAPRHRLDDGPQPQRPGEATRKLFSDQFTDDEQMTRDQPKESSRKYQRTVRHAAAGRGGGGWRQACYALEWQGHSCVSCSKVGRGSGSWGRSSSSNLHPAVPLPAPASQHSPPSLPPSLPPSSFATHAAPPCSCPTSLGIAGRVIARRGATCGTCAASSRAALCAGCVRRCCMWARWPPPPAPMSSC